MHGAAGSGELSTARLLLRPFRETDLDALHEIVTDPRAMRYWDRPAWSDPERTRRMLAMFMADRPDQHLEFAVEHKGRFIGRVGMWKRFEIGYIFHPATWGKGFGGEAVGALLPEIFARFPDAEALTAEIDPRNIASARLLEALGFACTHLEEKNFLYGEDEWCDTAYYVLARNAFPPDRVGSAVHQR